MWGGGPGRGKEAHISIVWRILCKWGVGAPRAPAFVNAANPARNTEVQESACQGVPIMS